MINETMRARGAESSAIREIFSYACERKALIGEDRVFDFSLGNPSVPAPSAVRESIERSLAEVSPERLHGYTPAAGLPEARAAVADSLNRRFGTSYAAGNVFMTVGAAASVSCALHALASPGDEVIVVAPYFPEYAVWVENAGATLVEVLADQETFQLDIDAIESAITDRTAAVIIDSPNNPTGAVYPRESLAALAATLERANAQRDEPVYLISDEPYREISYGAEVPWVPQVYDHTVVCYSYSKSLSLPGERVGWVLVPDTMPGFERAYGAEVPWVPQVYDHTVVCYSYSKSLSLPGERVGWVLVPDTMPGFERAMAAIAGAARCLGFVCAPALFQRVVIDCVDEPADVESYTRNRRMLTEGLSACGYDFVEPQGAFYLWVRALEPDARAFCERARALELLPVPSDSFGVPGWVRVGYCVDRAVIERSLPAWRALAETYRDSEEER